MDKIIQKLKELKRRANIAMLERLYKFHIRIRYGHDYVYSKGGWYKNYSDKGYTQAIHKISVITFALSFVVFTVLQSLWPYLFSLTPRKAMAGTNSVVWTSANDFTSNDVTATAAGLDANGADNLWDTADDPWRSTRSNVDTTSSSGDLKMLTGVTRSSSGFLGNDNFNRANSSSLGANWTETQGDSVIDTNTLKANAVSTTTKYTTVPVNDYVVEAKIMASNDSQYYVQARTNSGSPGNTFYLAQFYLNTNFRIYKSVGGAYTELATTTMSPTFGNYYNVKLSVIGNSIIANMGLGQKRIVATDSSIGSGDAAIFMSSGSNQVRRVDDFAVYKGHNITVTGLPTGYKAGLWSGTSWVNDTGAAVAESGGSATIVSENVSFPYNGYIRIVDSSNNLVNMSSLMSDIYGGDSYNFNSFAALGSPSANAIGLRIDAGSGKTAKATSLTWNGTTGSTGQKILFKVRAGDTQAELDTNQCYGPSALDSGCADWTTAGEFFSQINGQSNSSTTVSSSISAKRYIEVLVRLESDGTNTPTLSDVTLNYDTIEAPASGNTTIYKSDGSTNLKTSAGATLSAGTEGGYTNETSVKVTAAGLTCSGCSGVTTGRKIEVEYKLVSASFDGTTNLVEGNSTNNGDGTYTSTANITGLAVGSSYHLRMRTKDDAGRVSGWTSYGAGLDTPTAASDFTIDQTSPTASMSIASGATYSSNQVVSIAVTGSDTGGAGLSQAQFSNDGINWGKYNSGTGSNDVSTDWTNAETFTSSPTSFNWKLSDNDAEKTVYVRVRDNAGNVSGKVFSSQADWEAATGSNLNTTGTSGDVKIGGGSANLILFWDGVGAVPDGWTDVSASGQAFYQKFPRGDATYGGTSGAATHTHSASLSVGSASGSSNMANTGANNINTDAHTHTGGTPSIGTASNLPPYRNLRIIKANGVPETIPSGAIALFDTTVPTGWTRYSAQDNYFTQGEASAGGTGGSSANRSHSLTSTTGTASGGNTTGGSGTSFAASLHTHSVSTTVNEGSNEPSFITVILGKADSNVSLPSGMIGMFDAAPPGNWTNLSTSGQAFYQKYFKGSATYGTTGGSLNHTPTNTGFSSGSSSSSNSAGGTGNYAISSHNHTITPTYGNADHQPPYVNVIIAKGGPASGTIGGTGTGLRTGDPTGSLQKWSSLYWSATGLSDTNKIGIQVRPADTWGSGDTGYVNPSTGDSSYYYLTSGTSGSIPLSSGFSNTKTFEVRVTLEGTSSAPVLHDLAVQSASFDSITLDTASPAAFELSSPSTNAWSSVASPTLSWNASSDGNGLSKYQLYINGSLDKDNISNAATSTTPTSPLTAGTYTWYIKAVDNAGNVTQSTSTYTVKVDLAAPVVSGITLGTAAPATDQQTSINVILSSGTATDDGEIAGYRVFRKEVSNQSPSTPVLTAQAGTGLAAGAYKYFIVGYDATGLEIEATAESSITTQASTQNINITWSSMTGATGYKVYRTALSGATDSEKLLKDVGNVTSYTDNATDTLTATDPTIKRQYKYAGNATSFPYTVTGLTNGQTYSFYIKAYDQTARYSPYTGNISGSTDPSRATVDTTSPQAPSNLTVTPTIQGDRLDLSWSGGFDGAGVTKYRIYMSTTLLGTYTAQTAFDVNITSTINDTGNTRNQTITGLIDNKTYYFKVSALDASSNESLQTSEQSGTPPDVTSPALPSLTLTATPASANTVNLLWTSATDYSSDGQTNGTAQSGSSFTGWYKLYRDTASNGSFATPAGGTCATTTSTSCTDSGLSALSTYYYKIKAVDKAGSNSNADHAGNNTSSLLPASPSSATTYTDQVPTSTTSNSASATLTGGNTGREVKISFTGAASSTYNNATQSRTDGAGFALDYYRIYRFPAGTTITEPATTNGAVLESTITSWAAGLSGSLVANTTYGGGTIAANGNIAAPAEATQLADATNQRDSNYYEFIDNTSYANVVDSGLTDGTTYQYVVVAFDKEKPWAGQQGNVRFGTKSSTITVTTPDTAASTEPTSVTNSTLEGANGSMPRLVVSWTVPTQSLRATTSTVSSLSSTNGTSLAVSAGTGLQFVTGQFIKIDSEILKITNIATDTLTVTRATNGSTAATHSAGAAISILDFTAYKLYKNSGLGYEEITSTTFDAMNENYYVDADIQQGYVYTYKVTIVDDAGRFKGYVSNQANQIVNSGVNNESTGITTTYDPSADLVAPTITYTNQAVSNGIGYSVTPTSATISWTTDESSSSVIEYGTSNSLGSTYGTSTGVTYHEVTIPNLTPQTTYYFIIKSSDGAENLTTKRNTGEIPFTLTTTLDTIAPSNPTTINAWNANTKDSTLTSGNWYNYQTPRFEWSGATDTESAISGYFVYFGTSSSGSPTSYQLSASPNFYTASTLTSGNTYYLRVKTRDAGNNDSSATTLFEYKYDGTAPTSTITSPSASANLSDVNSVTGTAVDTYSNIQNAKVSVKRNSDNKYLNSGKTAFDQATEVFIDATGQGSFTLDTSTVTWADSTYTITSKATDTTGNAETPSISTTFRIDNTAPPQVDLVAPVNISNVSTSTPTFVWNATEDSGSGLSYFELYIDGVLNTDNPQAIPVTDLNSSIRKKIITPLSEGSHTWYVKAYDRVGNSSSSASTLTVNVDLTKPTSTITSPSTYQYLNTNTLNITGTATKSATSNAEINSVQVSITKRGTSLNWVNVSSLSSSGSTRNWSYTWNIPSNDDGEYFIISKAIDTAGNEEAYKAGMTVAVDKTNPSISTSSITDITTTSLNINFETTEEVTYTLDYGTTLSYGSSFPISTFNTKSTARLTGLTEGKTYNYRITITDRAGNTVASINATFNMNALDHAAPVISGFAISSVTENSAIVSWNTDEVATTQVEYAENSGFTSSSLSPTSVDNTNLNKVHRVTLSGLTSNTLYYIKAKATDSSGNASETAGNDNFTTLRVPVVSPVTIQVTENATDKSITITWTSDEATSSIVQYAPETGFTGYDTEKTDGKVTLSTDHSVTLTDLAPLTTYKFRVGGTNAQSISSYQTATPDTFDTDFIDRVAPTITFSNQTLGNLSVQSHGSGIQPGVSSAVIKWDTDEGADSVIEYKKQGDSEYRSGNIDPKLLTQDHTVTLRSLTPSTTYVFRIKSRDNAGNLATSSEYSFTTLSLGIGTPVVATTSSSATVSWSTSIDSTSQVEYQKQNSNTPSKIDGDANLTKTHSVTIKNLSSGRYSYKVKSIDNDTNIAESNLLTFEIPSADSSSISAPQAGKIEEKDITATSAKITWTSTMQTTSWVDYGNTSGTYTLTTGNDVMTSDHVVTLDNLTPGLTYYYIVRGKDANGIEYKSEEFTFIAIAKPSVSSIKVTGVSSYKAIVLIDVTKETQLTVNYGKDRSFDLKAGGATLAKTHEVTLNDLEDGSAYFLNAEVKDVAGNSAVSETITFNTPLDTTGPAVKEVKIDLLPMGTDDETAQAIISWTTDKPSITQLEYDEGIVGNTYSQKTIPDESLKNAHTVIIKELNPSATYRFRIIGKDKKNNITRSNNYNFVTPNKEKSILQLIIRSLEETFSWVKDVGKKFTEVREKVFGK